MQNIAEIMADYTEHHRQLVLADTFGHLAAKKGKEYGVKILFATSPYSQYSTSLIDTKYSDGLEDSPWIYDAIVERINGMKLKKYGVYLLDGTVKNYRIKGRAKLLFTL